jgi:membrane associated rhomboid family serine protease
MLRPGDETPILSWGAAGVSVVLWIAGFFTDLILLWLVVLPQEPLWQVWRFVTTSFVYPGGIASILSVLLGVVFLLLNGPMIERELGRRRFATLFLVSGATGAAWMAIAGQPAFGLFTPIFGLLGCYLVMAWGSSRARTQILVMLALLVVVNLVLSPYQIFAMVGGFGAGVGAMALFRRFDGARSRTPYLVMIGGALFFVVIAVLRQLAVGR